MSTYGNRITELRSLMQQATTGTDEPVIRALTDCITRYADVRQRALDDLVSYIERTSMGNLGTASKWQSRIKDVRSECGRLFGDSVKDLMLPPPVQLFWFAAVQAEDKFFESLATVRTPQLIEDIIRHQDGLSKLIADLTERWRFLLDHDSTFERDEKNALKQADEIVQQILSDLDSWHGIVIDYAGRGEAAARRAGERIREEARKVAGEPGSAAAALAWEAFRKWLTGRLYDAELPKEVDDAIDAAGAELGRRKDALVERHQRYRGLIATYRALLESEKGSVLNMFRNTRAEVERYISTNDVPKAIVMRDQAIGFLNDWAGRVPTSAQREDARLLSGDCATFIESDWQITVDLDRKFRGQFQGAFLPPVNIETIEALAEEYAFKQLAGDLKGRDAYRKLGEAGSRLRERVDEAINRTLAPLDGATSGLPSEMRDLASLGNTKFRAHVQERLRRHIEAVLPFMEALRLELEAGKIDKDLGREELVNLLR
jgi:hypothetical protein